MSYERVKRKHRAKWSKHTRRRGREGRAFSVPVQPTSSSLITHFRPMTSRGEETKIPARQGKKAIATERLLLGITKTKVVISTMRMRSQSENEKPVCKEGRCD